MVGHEVDGDERWESVLGGRPAAAKIACAVQSASS